MQNSLYTCCIHFPISHSLKKVPSFTILKKRLQVFFPVGFVLGIFLIGVALGTLLVQQSQNIGPRAALDPYCGPSEIAALQYGCGAQGFSITACACNPPVSTPTSQPTEIPLQPSITSSTCSPGTSTCTGSIRTTCTNSNGTYTTAQCTYGCSGDNCANPPVVDDNMTVPIIQRDYCTPGTSVCAGKILYTCTNSNGTYSTVNCLRGCVKDHCVPKETGSAIYVLSTPIPTRKLTGTVSPRTTKIVEVTPIISTAIPSATILPEALVGPNGNVCYCKENGINVACKNQSLCCSKYYFYSREYVKDQRICETNDSLVRVPGVVQTNTAYEKNGCGPATLANYLIDSGVTTLPNGEPVTLENVANTYYHFSKPTDKTGLQQNLVAAQAFAPGSFVMLDQTTKDKNSLPESQVLQLMQEQVENGDKLIVAANVKNVWHWFFVKRVDETGVYGIDSYFDGDGTPNFDNDAGFVEYQKLGVDFAFSQIIVVRL